METQKPNWTYNEFLAYLLLYAANADLGVNRDEKEMLFSKVSFEDYKHIRKVFEDASDYESLQTILTFREEYFNVDLIFIGGAGQEVIGLRKKPSGIQSEYPDLRSYG